MGFNAFLPFFYDIFLSLNRFYLLTPTMVYIGLGNFLEMVNDPNFISALGRGILFAFLALAVALVVVIFLARRLRTAR